MTRHEIRRAEGTFQGATGTVYFRSWEPERPRATLLFLHGLGEHVGSYEPLGTALAAAGVAVYAHDHAGHGRSGGERVLVDSFDPLLADAARSAALAASAHPEVPLLVAGHSLGSTVAALLAAAGDVAGRPVAGLILAGFSLGASRDGLIALRDSGIDTLALRRDPAEMTRDADYAQQIREDPLTWQGGLRPETLGALIAVGDRAPAALAALASADLPVLLVHGARDDMAPVAGARAVADALPRARLAVFDDDLHNVLNEADRDAVYAAIVEFIDTVLDPTDPGGTV